MTNDDIDFIKSMCFQDPDITERQERRVRRIIDDMRMLIFVKPVLKEDEAGQDE